jgi:hypothetical protein
MVMEPGSTITVDLDARPETPDIPAKRYSLPELAELVAKPGCPLD